MFSFSQKIGIDLGTANILVYIPGKGIILNEPSVVAIREEDKKVMAVGLEAKEMVGKTPDEIIAYRPMKDGVIADYRVTEVMLSYFINKALTGIKIFKPDVLVSVPAGITSTERRAVIEATLKAGAGNAYIVKEPILAAIGAGIPIYDPSGRMIIDIGGGTTDIAVISLGGIVCSTSIKCAGNKMDQSIIDYIKKEYNLNIGDQIAEQIKIKIGSALTVQEELSMIVKGRDQIGGLPKSIEINTNEIVRALDKELKVIVKAIKDIFQDTPPELVSDIIDNGIIMTGGGSMLRHINNLVENKIGVKCVVANDAPYCVAKGTGEAINHLDVYKKSVLTKR
ncbi:MAG: rod shape-determining protein [Cyanobium sp. MAG06]|nr:rod shape-determining protein [Cyanobium sp. MAG06]